MILFKEDWNKHPNASIHLETRNRSFIDIAIDLKNMGIDNHAFMLALHDPALRHINPLDKNLDQETIERIVIEIKTNPWYFLREIARFNGPTPIPLEANRAVIAIWWLYLNHVTVYNEQPRQTGKTAVLELLAAWLSSYVYVNTEIGWITKDDNLRTNTVKRVKGILETIPDHLKIRTKKDNNVHDNISISALNNRFTVKISQNSDIEAYKVFRGHTIPTMIIDEAAFIKHVEILLSSALPATSRASEIARENNTPYGIVYITTAGDLNSVDGKYIHQRFERAMPMDERLLYDTKDECELHRVVRDGSNVNRKLYPDGVLEVRCVWYHDQLNKSDHWLMKTIEDMGTSDVERINRELFNIWSLGNGNSPLSPDEIALINGSRRNASHRNTLMGFNMDWYIPKDEIDGLRDRKMVMGIDSSDASGRDDIGVVVMDVETLEVLASMKYNNINIIHFGAYIGKLLHEYINTTLIIESRSTGMAIMDAIVIELSKYGIHPYKRIFNRIVNDKDESNITRNLYQEVMRSSHNAHSTYTSNKKYFGFPTSGVGKYSRETLYGIIFRQAVRDSGGKIHSPVLIKQLLELIIKNDRIDHDVGGHDDMVIAWLLCHYLLRLGTNISAYGINSKYINKTTTGEKKEIQSLDDFREDLKLQEQLRYRNRIDFLLNKLENNRDPYVSIKIENEIQALSRLLSEDEQYVYSISHMVQQAKDSRKKRI